jgi:hypothetical protein
LPWAFPGWVGNGSGSPYKFPNVTADYVMRWILAAKKYYQLGIDYIGVSISMRATNFIGGKRLQETSSLYEIIVSFIV